MPTPIYPGFFDIGARAAKLIAVRAPLHKAPHHQQHDTPPMTNPPEKGEVHRLSDREIEILNWVKVDKSNFGISLILCISSFTIKNRLQHIYKKPGAHSRLQTVLKIGQSLDHG